MKTIALALALLAAQAPAAAPPVAAPPVAPAPAASAAPAPAAPTRIPGMGPVLGRPNLLQTGVAAVPDALWQRAEQLLEARSARLLDVAANGDSVLITTRFGQTMQLHVVDRPMGARTQLTFGREPVTSGLFQPNDTGIVYFRRDVGGSENWQIYRLDRRAGKVELLTDGKSRHEALVLSPDGKLLAYDGTGRNGKDTDVYVAETRAPREARRLFEADGTWQPVDFSPDGARLLVRKFRSISDSDLYLVDVKTGERKALTPTTGRASVGAARFAADGRSVYLVTDRQGDFNELYQLDL
ncbi:MAG TPA: S9 family peptidase, partial [Anaeromyxobacteraceae bacterium]|nr:S9 family peptidase [Anaeromyxobacteraceae bacterium]